LHAGRVNIGGHLVSDIYSKEVVTGSKSKYKYLVWFVLAFAYVIVYFHRLAAGVVKDDLISTFGISGMTFANLSSMYFYAYMIMQIPSGILADTIGARKTVSMGVFVAGIGSVIFGFSPFIAIAFLGRILVGLGVSVVYVSILKTLSEWFKPDEFGTMTGITSFIGNMGGILAQAPLVAIVGWISWRSTFVAIGLLSICLAFVVYRIVRNSPTEIGLAAIVESNNCGEAQLKEKSNPIKGISSVLSNPRTWPPFVVFFACNGSFIALTGTWGQSYLMDVYGVDKGLAANYMSAAILGVAVGSIIIGILSDSMKKRKPPMLIFSGVNLICWISVIFMIDSMSSTSLWIVMGLLGLSTPAFILSWACGKELNHPSLAGSATSVVNMGGFLGAAVLPTIMGRIIDSMSGGVNSSELYQSAFIVCLAVSAISFVAILLIKETNCENIYEG